MTYRDILAQAIWLKFHALRGAWDTRCFYTHPPAFPCLEHSDRGLLPCEAMAPFVAARRRRLPARPWERRRTWLTLAGLSARGVRWTRQEPRRRGSSAEHARLVHARGTHTNRRGIVAFQSARRIGNRPARNGRAECAQEVWPAGANTAARHHGLGWAGASAPQTKNSLQATGGRRGHGRRGKGPRHTGLQDWRSDLHRRASDVYAGDESGQASRPATTAAERRRGEPRCPS